VVLLQFERSLNSYFVHSNNNYYYYLQHLGFCYLFNVMARLYVGLKNLVYIPNFMPMGEKEVIGDE